MIWEYEQTPMISDITAMNERGRAGWALVCVHDDLHGIVKMFWKRLVLP